MVKSLIGACESAELGIEPYATSTVRFGTKTPSSSKVKRFTEYYPHRNLVINIRKYARAQQFVSFLLLYPTYWIGYILKRRRFGDIRYFVRGFIDEPLMLITSPHHKTANQNYLCCASRFCPLWTRFSEVELVEKRAFLRVSKSPVFFPDARTQGVNAP